MKILYRLRTLYFISVFTIGSTVSKAQLLNNLQANFNSYQQNAFTEKVFVHTDKSFYLAGELIWFKLYNVDGIYNKPLSFSKVAYVDVLDEKNTPVMQAKIAMKDGTGSGSFVVPISLSNGNYTLRAYTSWMKNFSPDFYFDKKLTILNTLKLPYVSTIKPQQTFDVQFFPEGGDLVEGLSSKIGFKATDNNGKGTDIKGAVVNQRGDTVIRFGSFKFGMGNFTLTPTAGNNYKVVIHAGNKIISKDLPVAKPQGYVMQVNTTTNEVQVNIKTNIATGGNQQVYLLGHTRQVIKVADSAALVNGTTTFKISKNKFAAGISHLTVFNSAKQPVCERLIFIKPDNGLTIAANEQQAQYGTRKKVNIGLAASVTSGQQVTANLSMSVYKLDSLQTAESLNIVNYLWLTSELKGSIESPDYYFSNGLVDEAADNLMLTQGWRRFKWTDVIKGNTPAIKHLPEYEGHLITATVTNKKTGRPVNNAIGYLSAPGKLLQFYTTRSDSNGRALFNVKDYYGPGEIIAQLNPNRDSLSRIDILSPFSEQYTDSKIAPFVINTAYQQELHNYNLSLQVQSTYSGLKLKRYTQPVIDSNAFYTPAAKIYKLDDYRRFTTTEEILREYVSQVNILKQQKKYRLRILNENGFLDGPDPLILLDGVPVFDVNKAVSIDPLKVRELDVVPYKYTRGPAIHTGILSFLTYNGDLGGFEFEPSVLVLDYEGLQVQREFYSPVYENEDQASSRIPDFRNVLYWSPKIVTSKTGKTQVSFYTGDQTGKYIAVIQGITPEGLAGYKSFVFEVK